jgi:hypothetical protein
VTLTAARNSDADLWEDHLLNPGFRVLRGIWLVVSAAASTTTQSQRSLPGMAQ